MDIIKSKASNDSKGEPTVSYELERRGRIVTHILFNFAKPAQLDLFQAPESLEPGENGQAVAPQVVVVPDPLKRPLERLIATALPIPRPKRCWRRCR